MGSCFCGGVSFEIVGELEFIQICYCMQCRKVQGMAIVINILVQEDCFKLLSGSELLIFYEFLFGK